MNKFLTFKRDGEPVTTGKPLHYTASGLDDVYLFNGFEVETIDGEEYVTVQDLDGLWKAIGLHLVTTRKALAPKEIKFLRHHMNLTQAELASQMRVTDQTVARWEKGATELSGPADMMLRALFLGAQPEGAEQHLGKLIELWDELLEQDEPQARPAVFEHGKTKWKQSKRELQVA
jgi:putative transcriptional regulator